MTGTGALIVRVNVLVPIPPELLALNVTEEVAMVDGVPEMTPVLVLIDKPFGSPTALKLVGPLVAAIV